MGQSMERPEGLTLRQSSLRHSARSLQRSSRQSMGFDKRNSYSASKLQFDRQTENKSNNNNNDYLDKRNNHLKAIKERINYQIGIRTQNNMSEQRGNLGEGEPHSPNFRSVIEPVQEYGLSQWNAPTVVKQSVEASNSQSHHHDMTISFSKTKNQTNNIFQEDGQEEKFCLQQILEYEQESQNQNYCKGLELGLITEQSNCLEKQKREKLVQMCKTEANGKIVQNQQNQGSLLTPKKKIKNLTKKYDYLCSQEENKKIMNENIIQSQQKVGKAGPILFNDYDYADFRRKSKEDTQPANKNKKLSKNLDQVKEKLANKANCSELKYQLSKNSVHNISKNQKNDKCCEIVIKQNPSKQSKNQQQSRNAQCYDINSQNSDENVCKNNQISKPKINNFQKQNISMSNNLTMPSSCHEKDSFRSDPQNTVGNYVADKNEKPHKERTSQLLLFDGNNTYVSQKINHLTNSHFKEKQTNQLQKITSPRKKQYNFKQFMKKQNYQNKRKIQVPPTNLKYSMTQKEIHSPILPGGTFSKTCHNFTAQGPHGPMEDYQFYDMRSPRQQKKAIQRANRLPLFSIESKPEINPSKTSVTPSFSPRNKLANSKQMMRLTPKANPINYNTILHQFQQSRDGDKLRDRKERWKQEKLRHRSSQQSSKMSASINSKLLIF